MRRSPGHDPDPSGSHLPGLVGEQGEAVTDGLGLNEAHRLDLADLAEEAPAGPERERVDEKPHLVDEVVLDQRVRQTFSLITIFPIMVLPGAALSAATDVDTATPGKWRPPGMRSLPSR